MGWGGSSTQSEKETREECIDRVMRKEQTRRDKTHKMKRGHKQDKSGNPDSSRFKDVLDYQFCRYAYCVVVS